MDGATHMTTDDRIEAAAGLLQRYANFIRTVKADELEAHPYLPEVEEAITDLRAIDALPCKAGEPVAWLKEWTDGKGVKQRVVQLSQNDNRWVDAHFVTTMTPLYATPTPEAGRMREALEALRLAEEFIEQVGNDLHNRRCADWYPEGAHSAAEAMSEDMRLIGNDCMGFSARQALAALSDQPQQEKP